VHAVHAAGLERSIYQFGENVWSHRDDRDFKSHAALDPDCTAC